MIDYGSIFEEKVIETLKGIIVLMGFGAFFQPRISVNMVLPKTINNPSNKIAIIKPQNIIASEGLLTDQWTYS